MIRAFIAFALPEWVKLEIQSIIQPFKQSAPNTALKWVAAKNLHITLKFLGDITPNRIDRLANKIFTQLHPFKSFPLSLSEFGAFPSVKNPRILWIDVFPKDTVLGVYQTIEKICVEDGISADQKPFQSHITLARLRQATKAAEVQQLSDRIKNFSVSPYAEFYIEGVTVYQSHLTPQGPFYVSVPKLVGIEKIASSR